MAKREVQVFEDNPALPDVPDIHAECMKEFDYLFMALQEERAQALQDRRFVSIAGAQWEGDWGETFANSITVEINKTAQGTNDILRQYKANRYMVDFRMTGASSKDDAAEVLNGMYLADAYRSQAQDSQDNCFTEGLQGGYGAWRLATSYVDDENEEDEKQQIDWEPIIDCDQNLFWDPNAKRYDKSDAAWAILLTPLSPEAFKAKYGEDRMITWPVKYFKPYYDWYTPQVITVGEYYRVIEKSDTVTQLVHKLTDEKMKLYKSDDDYTKDLKEAKISGYEIRFQKKIKRKECRKWIMSGAEVLGDEEGQLIPGGMIPIIPFYGQRNFIDNMERARGHVRLAKDPQRVYNAQISKLLETAASAPIERPIFYPSQISGHEQAWADANLNRSPYALINPLVDPSTGQIVPTGAIGTIAPPQMSPVLSGLIQISANDIQELTSSTDGAGEVKANVSADAMNIAATRTDDKADLYLDNMQKSVQRCGVIYQAMAADIYFEEDREFDTVAFDKKQQPVFKTVRLNERITDPNTGMQVIKNQLSGKDFKVIAEVVPSTATQRDKIVKACSNSAQLLAATNPDLSSMLMSVAIINMDGEGLHDVQDYIRMDLINKGVIKPTEDEAAQIAQDQQNKQQEPPPAQEQAQLALAEQLKAQAAKQLAEAEESKSKVLVNQANADKIQAETGHTQVTTLRDIHTPIEKPEQKQAPVSTKPSTTAKPGFLDKFKNIFK